MSNSSKETIENVEATGSRGGEGAQGMKRPRFTLVQMLPDHPGNVSSLIFTKNGQRLFAGTFMNQIKIWDWSAADEDASDGEDQHGDGVWKHKQTLTCKSTSKMDRFRKTVDTNTISALALAPDDSFLVAGSIDKNIRVYQTDSTGQYRETQCIKTKAGLMDSKIGSVAISEDGKLLFAATEGPGSKIFVYKIGAGTTLTHFQTVQAHDLSGDVKNSFLTSLSPGPEGQMAVGLKTMVLIGNTKVSDDANRPVMDFEIAHEMDNQELGGVAWSPTGSFIAAVGQESLLRVWGKRMLSLQMVTDSEDAGVGLLSVAFSPESKLLIAGGVNGHLYVWRKGLQTETDDWVFAETIEVEGSDSMTSIAFRPGGKCVATGEMGVVRVWKYELGEK